MKIYNFSAGPSTLPQEVLLEAQKDFVNYQGTGMSVTEMSHRSKAYDDIHVEAIARLKKLMNISDDYEILFVQGGASTQFAAVPLNLLHNKADYMVTGNFAQKAYEEAVRFGEINVCGSSQDSNFTYIPEGDQVNISKDSDYVHITQNNTIFGTRFVKLPKTNVPIVSDMSSNILSEEFDVSNFVLIYAGAQKNIAPAGVTIVIAKKELINSPTAICPTMLMYKTQAKSNSLYNTPPCFSIYMSMLMFRWLDKIGGVKEIQKINEKKANLLYDFIDNSKMFNNPVEPKYRSIMNVVFRTNNPTLDAQFVKDATSNGIISIKGHKLVGGMRASIYNSMPIEGVEFLIDFMKKFEMENR